MAKFALALQILVSIRATRAECFWSPDNADIEKPVSRKEMALPDSENYPQLQISTPRNETGLTVCLSDVRERGAVVLCSSPGLKSLRLQFYANPHPPTLTKNTFRRCNQLEELSLDGNMQKDSFEISEDALENIHSLKKLYFLEWNMSRLGADVLKFSPNLTTLVFSFCDIHNIDSNSFANLKDLQEIVIFGNRRLSSLPKDLFKNSPELRRINLEGNAIQELTWDEFEGLTKLEELNLEDNKIWTFSADKIAKSLPNLKILNIRRNQATCAQVEDFSNKLKSKIKIRSVYYNAC